jgi:hypothetical protein
MAQDVLVAIGTRKGLFLASSTGNGWEVTGPHHAMTDVYAVAIDTRGDTPRLLAGVTSEHWGPGVATSDDLGKTWDEPDRAPVAFPADTGAALTRVWQLAPGPKDQPDVVYAGAEPSSLFKSTDGGRTFELVRGLWDHPHRETWEPGFGGQAVHTVIPHPTNPDHVTVAMSAGGVYRTEDGGKSFAPSNKGIKAYFMPDQFPEYGQCVHKLAQHPARPDRFYAQNHHGVYRSDDAGLTWKSIADGLPCDFGFPIVVHPHDPDTVYTFPIVADGHRFPPDGLCRVYRSRDAGETWEALDNGLPKNPYWTTILRDAMCADDADPAGVYFGSRSGDVYGSRDGGDTWALIAKDLPDVLSIRAAAL